MYRVRTEVCSCCELEQDVPVDPSSPFGTAECTRCSLHRGDDWVRAVDHAAMYRRALADASDRNDLLAGEREFYRDRAASTAKSAEVLVRVLAEIDDLHHHRGVACSCGLVDCRLRDLVADPAVARLIGTYDEHEHTLRELRRQNPGAFAAEWDDIDVTLVYPSRSRRPAGRHRAAG